jgi:hypothetical protein
VAHVIIAQTTTLPDASVDLSSQLRIPCPGRHLLPDSLAAESGVSAPVSERDVALWVRVSSCSSRTSLMICAVAAHR